MPWRSHDERLSKYKIPKCMIKHHGSSNTLEHALDNNPGRIIIQHLFGGRRTVSTNFESQGGKYSFASTGPLASEGARRYHDGGCRGRYGTIGNIPSFETSRILGLRVTL